MAPHSHLKYGLAKCNVIHHDICTPRSSRSPCIIEQDGAILDQPAGGGATSMAGPRDNRQPSTAQHVYRINEDEENGPMTVSTVSTAQIGPAKRARGAIFY